MARLLPKRAVRPERPRFNADDYDYVRRLVAVYCPPDVPRALRNRFDAIWPLERAVIVYMLRVELGWMRNDIARHLKRWGQKVRADVQTIEDCRDALPWVEKIADKLRAYRDGLL